MANTAQNFQQRLLSIHDLREAIPQGSDEFIQHLFNITQDLFTVADGGDDVTDQVEQNTSDIAQNASDIVQNTLGIMDNADDIADNVSAINQNSSDISDNSLAISTNATNLSNHISDTTTHGANGDIVGNNDFADESIGGVVKRMTLIADAIESTATVITPDVAAAPVAYDQAYTQTIADLTNANKASINLLVTEFNAAVVVLNNLIAASKAAGQMTP